MGFLLGGLLADLCSFAAGDELYDLCLQVDSSLLFSTWGQLEKHPNACFCFVNPSLPWRHQI